jgi:hypothetical protein
VNGTRVGCTHRNCSIARSLLNEELPLSVRNRENAPTAFLESRRTPPAEPTKRRKAGRFSPRRRGPHIRAFQQATQIADYPMVRTIVI